MTVKPLSPKALRPPRDPAEHVKARPVGTTSADGLIGQERAVRALRFGARIRHRGYNIFVTGAEGSGRHTTVTEFFANETANWPPPDEWVYVHNFDKPWKPKAIRFPAGQAQSFHDAVAQFIEDLRSAIPAAFETDRYKEQRHTIDQEIREIQSAEFDALQEKARAQDIGIIQTPMGFALAPLEKGTVIKPEVFNQRPEKDRMEVQKKIEALQVELSALLERQPALERKRRARIRELNAKTAATVVDAEFATLSDAFDDVPSAVTHLLEMRRDLIEHIELFVLTRPGAEASPFPEVTEPIESDPRFRPYLVNVVVARGGTERPAQASVVYEDHPTLARLVGRVEQISRMGALETDHSMIRAGALHHANGGVLILDARKLLTEPWAWEALKRALRSGSISITSAAQELNLLTTVSLEPEAIPLDLKVVLIGDPLLYYLLAHLDPEFGELFKVQADFDSEIARNDDSLALYTGMLHSIADRHGLLTLEPGAIARALEEAARLAGDAERMSLRLGRIGNLICESDHCAREAGHDAITAEDVGRAIEERTKRADLVREKSNEMITRDIVLIDTDGAKTGQVNGLSVIGLGEFSFGRPTRITARARMGTGKLIDIERETKLGGPIHSKGVLILSSYLAATYASDVPMSLWASLVFEQSYGGVEGDSASSAELYALLSALSGLPVKQSLAVTGSVNQLGEVQAIGGVNEKIEGFFDICSARGLTGKQGVLIPKANVKHLVLRDRVVDAVRAGAFAIYPVEQIDEGIALLTGTPAGERGSDGLFPPGTVNALVEERLVAFAEKRRKFATKNGDADSDEHRTT